MDGEAASVQARRARTLFGRLAPRRSGIARRHENPGKAPQGPKSDPSTHGPKYPRTNAGDRTFCPPAARQMARISLLPPKIRLYTAPSHTETWLKRPSGGSRAERLVCSHVSGGTNRRTDIMALPDFSMRQLLEAGVHFGHQSHRWNPKMSDFIF